MGLPPCSQGDGQRVWGRRPAGVTQADFTLPPGAAPLWPLSRAWKPGAGGPFILGKEAKSMMSLELGCCRF